jgi:hypothetical protein
LIVRWSGPEVSDVVKTRIAKSVDSNPIAVGFIDLVCQFVLQLDSLSLRDIHLENAVLPPCSVSFECSIHTPTIRVIADIVRHC